MPDPWEAAVLAYVQDCTHVTTRAILRDQFGWRDPARWTLAHQKRLGAILRQHGWTAAPFRDAQGRLVRGFQRRLPTPLQDRRYKENKVVTPVGRPPTPAFSPPPPVRPLPPRCCPRCGQQVAWLNRGTAYQCGWAGCGYQWVWEGSGP